MTDKSLNQINALFTEIAEKHKQINSFFWGDFSRAANRDNINFPLMVITPSAATKTENGFAITLVLTVCDKMSKDWREINEIQSDTIRIIDDITDTMYSEKWEQFSTISGAPAFNPFVDKGKDELTGWGGGIVLDVYSERDLCAIPFDNYSFDETLAALCDPVSIFEDGILVDSVASGGSYSYTTTAADGTNNVNKSDGSLITSVTVPSGSTIETNVADSTIKSTGILYTSQAKATETFIIPDVSWTDTDGSPQTTEYGGAITCQAASEKHTSEIYKTGQTVSYVTSDDGFMAVTENIGNGTDFYTLGYNNGFGSTNRFTLKDGTALTSANVYNDVTVVPNSIVVDWSTWDRVNEKVLCIEVETQGNNNFATQVANCTIAPAGEPATGWHLPNINEWGCFLNYGGNAAGNLIASFLQNYNSSTMDIWTSTTVPSATANGMYIQNNNALQLKAKTQNGQGFRCRYYTLTELGL